MYSVSKRDEEGRRVVTMTYSGNEHTTTFEDNPTGHYAHEMFIRGVLASGGSVYDEVWGQYHDLESGNCLIDAF